MDHKTNSKLCPACNEKKPIDDVKSVRCNLCVRIGKLVNCRVCTEPILKVTLKDPTTHRECRNNRKTLCPWNVFVRRHYGTLDGSIKDRMTKIGELWREQQQQPQPEQ